VPLLAPKVRARGSIQKTARGPAAAACMRPCVLRLLRACARPPATRHRRGAAWAPGPLALLCCDCASACARCNKQYCQTKKYACLGGVHPPRRLLDTAAKAGHPSAKAMCVDRKGLSNETPLTTAEPQRHRRRRSRGWSLAPHPAPMPQKLPPPSPPLPWLPPLWPGPFPLRPWPPPPMAGRGHG